MTNWRQALRQLRLHSADQFDQLQQQLTHRLRLTEPIVLIPYRGFGTKAQVFLNGRILEDKGIQPAQADDTLWENLHAMYLRFASTEIAGVRVQAHLQGETWEAISDAEGYFEFNMKLHRTLPVTQAWHEVVLTLPEFVPEAQHPVRTPAGQVVTPTVMSTVGIISDIDDTIVATQATNLLKMARIVFLNNARTRLPFEGVAAFYRALHQGRSGAEANPIFYVSSSPWNLYDLLVDFLALHDIPAGPLLLQDYGVDAHKFISVGHHAHKLGTFKRILLTYPMLPFILIGDSGQEDPEIYTQVVRDYPGRIRAIYIRDVSATDRDAAVQKLITEANKQGVEMLLVPDTLAAAHHASAHGFIHPDTLPTIGQAQRQDAAAPNDLELLVEEYR